jgi:hypothetical protein
MDAFSHAAEEATPRREKMGAPPPNLDGDHDRAHASAIPGPALGATRQGEAGRDRAAAPANQTSSRARRANDPIVALVLRTRELEHIRLCETSSGGGNIFISSTCQAPLLSRARTSREDGRARSHERPSASAAVRLVHACVVVALHFRKGDAADHPFRVARGVRGGWKEGGGHTRDGADATH